MIPLSVLDLSFIRDDGTVREALLESRDQALHAEALGYHRYWVAEHHAMPGIASAATSVVIGHLAAATQRMRIGAGGIMLPNHAPLVIAEQFGTLEALFPGRIDLGLGRAPGSDQRTMRALRRHGDHAERFPDDVQELMAYFTPYGAPNGVVATPGAGADIPVWLLGSSLFSAQLAAALGLPFAFASHFAPQMMEQAIDLYRTSFRPSAHLAAPHVMLAMNVIAADTTEEADYLATSRRLFVAALRQGRPGRVLPPILPEDLPWSREISQQLDTVQATSLIGTREQVAEGMAAFAARHAPDELMISAPIYAPEARLRALTLAREAWHMAGLD
ncbi:LLM class flavin-dependent oxidoreductase [Asaia sp. W19]|uniref:LLM class flavin-dependent oxidoreductase n=1 Tax=unclassified Asaia TaxID=2685023 RepID=UPI000F8E9FE3|nr:LLM class flavin-dependent oxidoreductase [Asaia sp. W19]RUT26139.1 LLM class flavin-dependent oxidoreductase [Asaia sp. W19]